MVYRKSVGNARVVAQHASFMNFMRFLYESKEAISICNTPLNKCLDAFVVSFKTELDDFDLIPRIYQRNVLFFGH